MKIVTEMLTTVDNFERALQSEKENSETAFYKGRINTKAAYGYSL